MAGGLIEVRYEIVSTGPSYDTICIVVYSPGVLVNAEICVIGLSLCSTASCSRKVFIALGRRATCAISMTFCDTRYVSVRGSA